MPRPYGQHFLRSVPILERIAKAVAPEGKVPHIVEIGPGRGALTRHLLALTDRLTAIEVDPEMVRALASEFPEHPVLEVVFANVLETDLGQWGRCVLAGNLPYYISSPIMSQVFAAQNSWERAVFLVQLEVAQRMAAAPNSRDYGYLSVLTQLHARAKILFQAPPGAFSPPPKVKSAVILLEPLEVDREWAKGFLKFVSAAFHQKRKTLRNNLGALYPKERVEAQPESGLRAEQLGIEQLKSLYARLLS